MSGKVLRDAVEVYLKANWTATVIAGAENEIDEPPGNLDPWLSFGFSPGREQEVSIGNPGHNCHRETGIVYFNVWVASGRGTATALGYAENVRTLMRHKDLGNGVRLDVAHPPETGIPSQTNSSEGSWFAYQVSVEYLYEYQP